MARVGGADTRVEDLMRGHRMKERSMIGGVVDTMTGSGMGYAGR